MDNQRLQPDVDRATSTGGYLWLFVLAVLSWIAIFALGYWIFAPSTAAGEILFDRLPILEEGEHFDPDAWVSWEWISCRRGTHPDSCGGEPRCYPERCFAPSGDNLCCLEGRGND